MVVSDNSFQPIECGREWIDDEKPNRYYWLGYTERFNEYKNVTFRFPPIVFNTHNMEGWRMHFRQKTVNSRLYLHFHNKKNFGFRIRLPARLYHGIEDFFWYMYDTDWKPESSELSVTNIVQKNVYIETAVKSTSTLEEALAAEKARILVAIGDYRGVKVDIPDNVIDFSEYIKEPKPIETTDNVFNRLLKNMA